MKIGNVFAIFFVSFNRRRGICSLRRDDVDVKRSRFENKFYKIRFQLNIGDILKFVSC